MDSAAPEQLEPTRIAAVELRVSDPEASAEFYRSAVGLEIGSLNAEAAELTPPNGGETLVRLLAAERPGRAPLEAAGLFHTAFRYPDRAGLATALRRVAEEVGWSLTGASDHGVSEALYLNDPDGLGIELYRDRPRAEWPAADDPANKIGMFTEPLNLGDLAAAATDAGPESWLNLDIGHIHLKVADTAAAVDFWSAEVGMELMVRYGSQAVFLASDGYHHHIGANSWYSAGAALEPRDGPGLEAVVIKAQGDDLTTPDGVTVRRELRG